MLTNTLNIVLAAAVNRKAAGEGADMNKRLEELAVQAGAELYGCVGHENICVNGKDADNLMRVFAELVRQDAMEEAAKICDELNYNGMNSLHCAAAIRNRSEEITK